MAKEKRLIDANALMGKIEKSTASKAVKGVACVFVNDAPTVDAVEVVHGSWVSRYHRNILGDYFRFHCSECGEDKPNSIHINYCPNCGARMRGDEE